MTVSPAVRLPDPGLAAALTAAVAVLSAVPAWQFTHWQWIAFSVAAPVVLGLGAPVLRAAGRALRRGRIGVETLVAAGPLAALGWSAYVLLTGPAGDPGFTQSPTDPTLALDAAAALTVVALAGLPGPATRGPATRGPETSDSRESPRVAEFAPPTRAIGDRWDGVGVAVSGTAVAVLGFGLGAGTGTGAVAGAVAVLVAGWPGALRVAARWAAPPRTSGPTARCADLEILRLAAALHAAHPGDRVARAVVAAAGPDLPGVSDADGTPAAGLRGIVSELRGRDIVVAHAVLAGPADWLAAHGVAVPEGDGTPDDRLLVAWDGEPRGRIEIVPTPPREAGSARAARYLAVTGALTGAVLGALGILGPAAAVVVPLVVTVLVVASIVAATAIRARRPHPNGATGG